MGTVFHISPTRRSLAFQRADHDPGPACHWRTIMAPDVVEQIAAPIRRRMACSQSPLPAMARRIQLADHAPLN